MQLPDHPAGDPLVSLFPEMQTLSRPRRIKIRKEHEHIIRTIFRDALLEEHDRTMRQAQQIVGQTVGLPHAAIVGHSTL
ncbi:MAG: hypothetical protein WC683_15165 [bacterium]